MKQNKKYLYLKTYFIQQNLRENYFDYLSIIRKKKTELAKQSIDMQKFLLTDEYINVHYSLSNCDVYKGIQSLTRMLVTVVNIQRKF